MNQFGKKKNQQKIIKMKVVPIGRKVLIKNKKAADYYAGTTILRTETVNEHIATVVAVGDAVETLSVGDTVKYSEHADGIEMKHDGDNVLLMNCDMIYAKIVDE
tara:strand:+ start:510 stop:821 length:312 start_codon:yes stop_codon:yes gene_type:complete